MKIAIVGGTGMLGKRVARELSERGHEVRILGRRGRTRQSDKLVHVRP